MTGLIIAIVIAVLAQAGVVVFLTVEHRRELRDLHDRLAAKSVEDYHYWRDRHPVEVMDYNRRLALNRQENEAKLEKFMKAPSPSQAELESLDAAKQL